MRWADWVPFPEMINSVGSLRIVSETEGHTETIMCLVQCPDKNKLIISSLLARNTDVFDLTDSKIFHTSTVQMEIHRKSSSCIYDAILHIFSK